MEPIINYSPRTTEKILCITQLVEIRQAVSCLSFFHSTNHSEGEFTIKSLPGFQEVLIP